MALIRRWEETKKNSHWTKKQAKESLKKEVLRLCIGTVKVLGRNWLNLFIRPEESREPIDHNRLCT